jgi:hypothetical protein
MNDPGGTPTRLRAIPGDMYLRDLTAQDVIDRLWLVAQDRALDDGTHYAYIRAAIELIERLRHA